MDKTSEQSFTYNYSTRVFLSCALEQEIGKQRKKSIIHAFYKNILKNITCMRLGPVVRGDFTKPLS
jgi:hypothetical protein